MLISIHAPRGGSDRANALSLDDGHIFQSTLPVGGATSAGNPEPYPCGFQSTLPVGGATGKTPGQAGGPAKISIHAPRGGSDPCMMTDEHCPEHFNPRSPWGERPGQGPDRTEAPGNFNPRSPWGERRMAVVYGRLQVRFQSTLPVGGATR